MKAVTGFTMKKDRGSNIMYLLRMRLPEVKHDYSLINRPILLSHMFTRQDWTFAVRGCKPKQATGYFMREVL